MDTFNWQTSGASLAIGADSLTAEVGTNTVAINSNGDIKINGQPPIVYDDVTVIVSYAAGTIGTRGGTYSLGTTTMSGYTFMGAYVIDDRNTSAFNANVGGNMPNSTAHLAVYRATGNAVTDAEVTVRKVWASNHTVT